MSKKPANGKADPGGSQGSDLGGRSIAQGLQSVMAVIGECYDASEDQELAGVAPSTPALHPPTKLTDKIDAARNQQGASSSSSVTAGLQSIMAVIGESYDEGEAEEEASAPKQPAREVAAPKSAAAGADDDILSDLMPLLTEEEKQIGGTHHPVVEEQEARAATTSTSLAVTTTAAAAGGGSIQSLLNQLKADIGTLEQENTAQRHQLNMPAVIDSASNEVKGLLAQLQGDISSLRTENDALKMRYNIPVAGGAQSSEVASLLSQLQGDIAGLRQENDALKHQYGIPVGAAGGGEVSHLLAQLQGDIANMRHDNEAFKTQYNVPAVQKSGTSFGQAFLMTLGLLALIGGATLGGFYFANRMNDKSQENLLALIGMQQKASKVEAVSLAPRPTAPTMTLAPAVKVAAAPRPKAPALPKVKVRAQPKLESAEVQALIEDADNLVALGDLVSARQMLEYAMSQKSPQATFKLAQTYDPLYLSQMATVLSVNPNLVKAKVLYYSAARLGHQGAAKRLTELRQSGN